MNLVYLRRLFNVSVLSSISLNREDRLQYARSSTPANAADFLMARCNNRSRAIAHVRSNGQPEAATVGPSLYFPRCSFSHLPSRIISVHCLAAYNQEDLAVLCVVRKKRELSQIQLSRENRGDRGSDVFQKSI